MAFSESIATQVTQTTSGLLSINAAWSFSVPVPGTLATSTAIVTPQDGSFLSDAPIVSVAKDTVNVKLLIGVSLAAGTSKNFNIRVFV